MEHLAAAALASATLSVVATFVTMAVSGVLAAHAPDTLVRTDRPARTDRLVRSDMGS